jgi:hypothetical protein
MCAFLTFLVASPGIGSVVTAFCLAAGLPAACGWAQASGRLFRPTPLKVVTKAHDTLMATLWILVGFTSLAAILLLVESFHRSPYGQWDAHAMWNARAVVMFRAPEFWRNVFGGEHPHADYPLSLSILVYTGWALTGRETPTVPFVLAGAFLVAAALVVGVGLAIWKNLAWGLVGSILVLCSVAYVSLAAAQYADVPLSAFYAVSLVLFTLAYREREARAPLLALAGAATASCGWIKNEGLLMHVGLTLGFLPACILLRHARKWPRHFGWFWIAAIPILALLMYYHSFAPGNDMVQGLGNGTVQQKLFDVQRWALIAKRYSDAWWNGPGTVIPLMLIPAFLLLMAGIRVEQNLRLPLTAGFCAVSVVAANQFGAYLLTHNDLVGHLDLSVNRLTLQLLPSFVFLSMALGRADFLETPPRKEKPEETAMGGNDAVTRNPRLRAEEVSTETVPSRSVQGRRRKR